MHLVELGDGRQGRKVKEGVQLELEPCEAVIAAVEARRQSPCSLAESLVKAELDHRPEGQLPYPEDWGWESYETRVSR